MPEKPYIYCRYVDDIFIDIQNADLLESLRLNLCNESVLNFTVEKSVDNRIAFLDIDVDASEEVFKTKVYRKPTDSGHTLDGRSECPDRYKESVVRAAVHRALKYCSSWQLLWISNRL